MENSNPSLYNSVVLIGIKYSYFSEAGSDDNFKTFPVEFEFWTIFFPRKTLQEGMVYESTYTQFISSFCFRKKNDQQIFKVASVIEKFSVPDSLFSQIDELQGLVDEHVPQG